jgi:hypothetical protein
MGGRQSTNALSNDLNRFESTCVVGSTQLNIENMSFTTRISIQDKVGKGRKASRIKWERNVSLGNTTKYISGERTGKALDNALREDLYNASKYRSCDLLELTCLNSTKKTTLFILLVVHVRGDLGGDTHEEGEGWRTQLNNNEPTTLWRNSQITMQRPGNLATQMQDNFTSIIQQGQRRIRDEHLVQTTQRLIKKRIKMSLNNSEKINRLSPHIHTINLKSDGCPFFSFDGYCLPQDTSSFSFSLALTNFKSYFSLGLRKLMTPSLTLLDKKTNELPNHVSVNDPMIINTKHSNTPCLINLCSNSKEAKCSSAKDVHDLSKASFIDVSNFCTENFGLL